MPSSAPSADNCLTIAGQVAESSGVRTTPAGVPIGQFLLDHHSGQVEAGVPREVRCRIPVVACGEPLARTAGRLAPGDRVCIRGFVGRANYRQGESRLVLHAAQIDVLQTE
jgi:primosomal replication protein N